MQACSRLPGGASKPVCNMALLALLTPERMSAPRSMSTHLSPPRANRRKIAQPTTPAPMTARSKGLAAGAIALQRQARRQCLADCRLDLGQRCEVANPFVIDAFDRGHGHAGIGQARHGKSVMGWGRGAGIHG